MSFQVYQQFAQVIIEGVAIAIDLVVVVIIGTAVVRTLALYAIAFTRRRERQRFRDVRLRLGLPILLGLEFLIAADILRTSIAPSWTMIGQLAAIIVLRTFLDFALEWELERMNSNEEQLS
jgi:uncharacterized membrane protein